MTQSTSFLFAAVCTFSLAAPALAADPAPAEAARPAFNTRVGGSPADAEFRAVIAHSGDEYRQKRAACRKMASAEQRACLDEAKATLAKERADAKAAHDQATRAARGTAAR